jgi:methylenetetrahydrofolate reductase (NADPH)
MAWKDEAFGLWNDWIGCVEDEESKKFLTMIKDTYYLVSIVDNDFVRGDLCNNLIDLLKTA